MGHTLARVAEDERERAHHLGPLRDSLNRYAIPTAASDVTVVAGELGKRAEVMGALALVLSDPSQGVAHELSRATGALA